MSLSTNPDWSQLLHNNHEAQDLLSTAIAHHHQYRDDDDPLKRKGALPSDSGHNSDDVHAPGDGKPAPKKAGRKPLTTEPTNKRKAQNRAAQRAFRDRKEKYVKSLEDRIKELEEMNPSQSDSKLLEENTNLKVLVQKLETENYYLKEQAFTFDFPITQPGLYNVAKASRDGLLNPSQNAPSPSEASTSASQTMDSPSSKSSSLSPAPAKPSHDQLPWSPPSSVGDSVPNSPLDRDRLTPEHDGSTPTSHADSPGVVPNKLRNTSSRDIALLSSLADGAAKTASATDAFTAYANPLDQLNQSSNFTISSTIASTTSPMSTLTSLSEHTPSPSLNDLLNVPIFPADPAFQLPATSGLPMSSLMFDPTHALFSDFRDPSDPHDFLASLEDPVDVTAFPENSIGMGDLFNDPLLDYTTTTTTTTLTNMAPVSALDKEFLGQAAAIATEGPEFDHKGLPPLKENEKAIPASQVWQHLAQHPNFDDADIDDLCTDMKAKAKCSGHGPVIALTDVNNLMNKLDHE